MGNVCVGDRVSSPRGASAGSSGVVGGAAPPGEATPQEAAAAAARKRAEPTKAQDDELHRLTLVGRLEETSRRLGKQLPLDFRAWPSSKLVDQLQALREGRT